MPIILIVDDSPVDRALAGKLLEKDTDLDWVIEYADNAKAALSFMEDVTPHVVVTDMMMPGMNGLEFVAAARAAHPEVPVILMTGQGSESLAIEALARGAASYVPKGQMMDMLLDTVQQVLAVARADSSFQRFTECLVQTQVTLRLPNEWALISGLADNFEQLLGRIKFSDAPERIHLGIALEEALMNALCHGNLALSPEQVHEARSEWGKGHTPRIIRERQAQPPYRDRTIWVQADISPEEVRLVIRDEGAGFSQTALPARGDPRTLERREGRGLVLMRNFMDEVTFNEIGNEVTLVKRRNRS